MVENLRLDLSTNTTLTTSNTDLRANWTPNKNTVSTQGEHWGTGTKWDDGSQLTPEEIDTAHSYNGNGSLGTKTVADADGVIWQIGNYYNWYAATAGSGNSSLLNGSALDSICSKGWQLPYPVNRFQQLADVYEIDRYEGVEKIQTQPLSFILNGEYQWSSGKTLQQNAMGRYWSTVAVNSEDVKWQARSMHIYTDGAGVLPNTRHVRAYGFGVRCVARR